MDSSVLKVVLAMYALWTTAGTVSGTDFPKVPEDGGVSPASIPPPRVEKSAVERLEDWAFGSVDDLFHKATLAGANVIDVPVRNWDGIPSMQVKIGNVSLRTVIDTGSSDLWFASSTCKACPAWLKRYTYDANKDTKHDATLWYGLGTVSGDIVSETIQFGSNGIPKQLFVAVSQWNSKYEGLWGVGWGSVSWVDYYVGWNSRFNPVLNLWKDGAIPAPVMGFYTDPRDVASSLTLGAKFGDQTKYTGAISFVKVSPGPYWETPFLLTNPSGGNLIVESPTKPSKVMFDTGAALNSVDYATAKKLNTALGAWEQSKGLWVVQCSKLKQSKEQYLFKFPGNVTVSLSANKMILLGAQPDLCYAPFKAIQQSITSYFLVGQIFLSQFYVIFDYNPISNGGFSPRVGFASSI